MARATDNAKEPQCPSCKTIVPKDAKFCPDCGALVNGAPAAPKIEQPSSLTKLLSSPVLVVALGGGLIFAAGYIVSQRNSQTAAPPPARTDAMSQLGRVGQQAQPPRSPAPPGSAQNIDLSTMTPLEAADRLFNRVMAADEGGDAAQASRFAPMAVQAYGRVRQLDADAQFHVGLLHLVLGNKDKVLKQIEILRRDAPDHLLAMSLAIRVAKRDGDNDTANKILARFGKVYNDEIARGRPEYSAHRITVEKLRDAARAAMPAKSSSTATAAATSAEPATSGAPGTSEASPGAQVYAKNCARCHGPNATGSANGPPLVNKIYEPSHHGNDAFYRAVRSGVKSHHWSFGDMPPLPGVSDQQIGLIIAYVRKLQVANGIR